MKFTKTEWEIISHRLGVPDAIAEVLSECQGYDPEEIESLVYAMQGINGEEYDYSDVEMEILDDCCEGSTYFANLEDAAQLGEVSRGWLMSMHRAANKLEGKLNVSIPRC